MPQPDDFDPVGMTILFATQGFVWLAIGLCVGWLAWH